MGDFQNWAETILGKNQPSRGFRRPPAISSPISFSLASFLRIHKINTHRDCPGNIQSFLALLPFVPSIAPPLEDRLLSFLPGFLPPFLNITAYSKVPDRPYQGLLSKSRNWLFLWGPGVGPRIGRLLRLRCVHFRYSFPNETVCRIFAPRVGLAQPRA